jgi:hypothetical protein
MEGSIKVTRGYVIATSWAALWGVAIIVGLIAMFITDHESPLHEKILGLGCGILICVLPVLAAIGAITEFVKQRGKP